MDESINNIYFLKETISKFKNEIQKFITNPQYANHNAINIRHSLEDLEKNILSKEKNIASQILNNNNPTFNPIASRYSSLNILNNSANSEFLSMKNVLQSKKPSQLTELYNNITNLNKTEILGNTSLSNSPLHYQLSNNINDINYNISNNYDNINNININQGLNLTSSINSPQTKHTTNNYYNGLSSQFYFRSKNNRDDIPPEIPKMSENYYDLQYITKKKAMLLGNMSENTNSAERTDIFVRRINSRYTEENEKNCFKSTVVLRRVNDEIHEKLHSIENAFKENKIKRELEEKYDIARKKLGQIKIKRSIGNFNYMDRKKLQKFAFNKRSFFNSVNLDKNKIPIITPEEIERGLLSMINRGVIPRQADLTPAFNRDGHPITMAAGSVLREIYAKNNIRDDVEIENSRSLERVKMNVNKNKESGLFLTAAQSGKSNITHNAVKSIPKISLFNSMSKKNHKIKNEDIAEKDKIKEISELEESQKHENKFKEEINRSKDSIEKFADENNDNVNKEGDKIEMGSHIHSYNNNSSENLDLQNHLIDKFPLIKKIKKGPNDTEENLEDAKNINKYQNKYSNSYYKTKDILQSKIYLTKSDFYTKENKDNKQFLEIENSNTENANYTNSENLRYNNSNAEDSMNKEKKELENSENLDNSNNIDKDSEELENLIDKKNLNEGIIVESSMNTEKSYIFLYFKNYMVVKNEEYNMFKYENEENWGKINYIINQIQKLFKKLNFRKEEIDSKKLLNLAKDELRNITNRDLIMLLSDRHINYRGLKNKKIMHLNLKEAFALRIQNFFRMYVARKKYIMHKILIKKVKKIQRVYRLFNLKKIYNILIEQKKNERFTAWRSMMNNFKANWNKIKQGPRIEIHINSIGFNNLKNSTFEKFNERQNNQLNRLVGLKDPNIEIIYICPFEVGNEVLSYYFSILSTMGIENVKERFHLVIPEEINNFSPSFSLTQMLLFSSGSLENIRKKIANKNAYIIPGILSRDEYFLSNVINCPILSDEFDLTQTLFTKSGSKRVFELNNIPFPISAWDIQTESEFYETLADLIRKYLHVNVWLFKIDNEINGRGIAYIQLDKIQSYVDLKKERTTNSISEENFLADLKILLVKAIPKYIELGTPKLYKNFKDFLKNYLRYHGIIESCPTPLLSGIIGSPCISMLIEPDGTLELLSTYDKININYFKNICAVSPQKSALNINAESIVDKIGNYLFKNGIIGYVTLEYISFNEGQRVTSWAIDLKYGHTDIISCIKFCDFLDRYSILKMNNFNKPEILAGSGNFSSESIDQSLSVTKTNKITENSAEDNSNILPSPKIYQNKKSIKSKYPFDKKIDLSHIKKPFPDMENHFRFYLPIIISSEISKMKMRELVQLFRSEMIIYDMEKRNGIVFNLADIIQCSMFGICGLAKSQEELIKILKTTTNLMKNRILKKDFSFNKNSNSIPNIARDNFKFDSIDFSELLNRIFTYVKDGKK